VTERGAGSAVEESETARVPDGRDEPDLEDADGTEPPGDADDTGEVDEFDGPGPRRRRVWLPAVVGAVVALCLVVAAVLIHSDDGDSAPGPNSPEAGFARDMAVHHEQAVEMSFLVRDDTTDKPVRDFAYDIINTQANQRGMMLGWLDLWHLNPTSSAAPMAWMGDHYKAHDGSLMPGMATNTQMDELRRARGKAAEILFLRLMIAHHKGGIGMAQGLLDRSHNPQVDRLASGIVQSQRAEIDLMNTMLKERGAPPVK
jgi:uncharacterized protein (DUF305 family)